MHSAARLLTFSYLAIILIKEEIELICHVPVDKLKTNADHDEDGIMFSSGNSFLEKKVYNFCMEIDMRKENGD